MAGLSSAGLARLDGVMSGYAERAEVTGLAWGVTRGGRRYTGSAGAPVGGEAGTLGQDAIFRISSMTKPITAVATLLLVEDCRLRIDDAVDRWLPELADRRVLRHPDDPLEDTVPAHRPVTVRDLLTLRLGLGMDFATSGPQPVLEAMAELGLGAGPPAPAGPPEPDEWMRRLGTLPLAHQPGERWLYHTGSDVLGVLVTRVSGQPLEAILGERIFDPLGMADTCFAVPPKDLHRLGACYSVDPGTGERQTYDPPAGQWSRAPAFPSGGGGLVSTVDDYLAFAEMLLAGGAGRGARIVSRPSVEAMTIDQLTPAQTAAAGPDPTGAMGWGFGIGVQVRRTGPARSVGSYGWDGGLGSSWANDPAEGLAAVLLTDHMWNSPTPPPVCADFWTCVYAAFDD